MVYGEGPIPARGPVHGGYRDARGRQIVPAPMAPAHATPAEHMPRSAFPEIDCVRDWLPRPVVADAERRASAVGVGAERVLISSGVISEDRYFYALSHWLGLGYETFEQRTRESCPLDDHQLLEAAKSGLLPLRIRGQTEFVVAPRSVPQLVDFVLAHPRVQVRLTSTRRLNQFIAHHSRKMLGYRAAGALTNIWPHLSAASRTWRPLITLAAVFSIALALLIVFPDPTLVGIETILATGFLAWLMLRWFGSFVSTAPRRLRPIPDHLLPFYTIIVPLYGEARSVGDLVNSLRALSYPPEKLDIKFIVEPDDVETSVVLKLRAPFEIITAPSTGPRTKPKALNAALPFALGTFIVVYDAEDRPEPDQLQRAVEAFQTEPDNVACVQARLTIDNTADGWLASLFTAEYAAQFDLFLPGLAALKLPLHRARLGVAPAPAEALGGEPVAFPRRAA